MIQLHQYKPAWELMNISPFCMKVEVFLCLNKLPYQTITLPDPRKSPKGKLPYIKDGNTTLADSSLIFDYLIDHYQLTIDQQLTPQQRTLSIALQRLIEDHLYWIIVYSRWIEKPAWQQIKSDYFGSLPPLIKHLVPAIVKRSVKQALHGQGLGRHNQEEIYRLGIKDLNALKTQLDQHPFLLDTPEPTSIDSIGYAFIANILLAPIDSPLKQYAEQSHCFQDYCDRMANTLDRYKH